MRFITGGGAENTGVVLDRATEKEILALAGMVASLIGGPYATVGVRVLQLAQKMVLNLQTDPEFIPYFESLEALTKAYQTRHGGKT